MDTSAEPDPSFKKITNAIEQSGARAYLVGGYLRDRILGRTCKDVDFVVFGDAVRIAKTVALRTAGRPFIIDETRGISRIVYAGNGNIRTADFAQVRGDAIDEDLAERDFTINAMASAIDLTGDIIDPFGGMDDIRSKTIRHVSETATSADPVRMIRAFRLAADLAFSISPDTKKLIKKDARSIEGSPGERVRREFLAILDNPHCAAGVADMKETGLLPYLLSGDPDVEGLAGFERRAAKIAGRLGEPTEAGVSLLTLLKLSSLIGDAGMEAVVKTTRRLRLSRKSTRELKAAYNVTGDAQFEKYLRERDALVKTPPLLNGRDLIHCLGVEEGPAIGRLLRRIREKQLAGKIVDRESALQAAKEYLDIL